MEMFAENEGLRKGESKLEGSLNGGDSHKYSDIQIPEKYRGMNISSGQVQKIIDYAEFLKSRREKRHENELFEQKIGSGDIPIEGVYRLAVDGEISLGDLEESLKVNFPSARDRVEDVMKFKSSPSHTVVNMDFYNELKNKITQSHLNYEVENHDYALSICEVGQLTKKRFLFFGPKIVKKTVGKMVAWIHTGSYPILPVQLYDPAIFRLFGDVFNKVKARWNFEYNFEHSYNPYEK